MHKNLLVAVATCGLAGLLLAGGTPVQATTPVLTPIDNQEVGEGIPTAWLSFRAYDLETQTPLFGVTVSSSNEELLPEKNIEMFHIGLFDSWTLRLTPALPFTGTSIVTLTVTNESGLSATQQFQLTVYAVNQPPTLDPVPDLYTYKDVGLKVVAFSGVSSGATNEFQDLSVTAEVNPPSLLTNLDVSYTSPNPGGTVSFETISNATGQATITLTVNDGGASNNITSRSFTVFVHDGNYPPVLSGLKDIVWPEDLSTYTSYTVTDVESASQFIQVTATSSNQGLIPDANVEVIRAGYSGLIRLTSLPDANGEAVITVIAADPDGGSTTNTFLFTVFPVNDPPTLDSIGDMTVIENSGAQVVPLSGITAGPPNEIQTLTLSAFSYPPGVLTNLQITYTSPDSTGSLSFEPAQNAVGTATVRVYADDGAIENNIVCRIFKVQVDPENQPPTITAIADQVTDVNTPAAPVNFTVNDAETAAADLVVSAFSSNPLLVPQTPEALALAGNGNDWTLTITPAADQFGTAIISVQVSDTSGGQASSTFVITVRENPQAPYITVQPQGQILGLSDTLNCNVIAQGDDILSYQWLQDGQALEGQTGSTLTLSNVQASQAGNYTVVVSNIFGTTTSVAARVKVRTRPVIEQTTRDANGTTFFCESVVGQNYTAEFKDQNDTDWTVLESKPGTGGTLQFQDPGAKLNLRLYRIRVF